MIKIQGLHKKFGAAVALQPTSLDIRAGEMIALLGASGLGDIGGHFPDTAAEFAGADSRELLRRAYAAVRQAGWQAVNADCTVIAQRPKLAPHIAAMRANIAADLALPADCVNIKGKTNETLGYLGRCEAIEAQAVVLLQAA